MGNKLCKKKADSAEGPKAPTPFDRIINRLHLRPTSWKSESHLTQKLNNKSQNGGQNMTSAQPLSKSSDWTEVSLEVPDKDDSITLRNPKLSLIFDNEKSTPTPPPRKHKKGFKEKLEAVAKNSLQAFQSKKPVEEPLCVKKIVNHTCPLDDHDCAIHNRNHKHEMKKNEVNEKKNEERLRILEKDISAKRKKNLSVVSLPNYNELKLTVANFEDIDNNSMASLPGDNKKIQASTKVDKSMPRCRSFGSLLPQQLLDKLRVRKIPADIESDDSFGALEDWDLRIIEHYNPKDASLPRPRKTNNNNNNSKEVLADIESLIVKDEDIVKPVAPARRSESLLKKINRDAMQSANSRRSQEIVKKNHDTPPPSPQEKDDSQTPLIRGELATQENGIVEHSSLMKILEEFSIKDKKNKSELQDKISSVEDFLNNEKLNYNNTNREAKLSNMEMVKT